MVEKNGILFERKIFVTGGSQAIILPPELLSFLQVQEGTEIQLSGYEGNKGKFIALWKKKGK